MTTVQYKTTQKHLFQNTLIKGPDGKNILATVHPKPSGCVLYFYQNEKPLENEYKDEKKKFSVFIKKNARDVLKMLSSRKGQIGPHRKNPKQLFLCWERVMVPTNFTLDGNPLTATFETFEKKDKHGAYWLIIIHFYTKDGKALEHTIKKKNVKFTHFYKTESKYESTDKANRKWLLQEGQFVPHEECSKRLFLRIGKAPVKTSFTIKVDGKDIPVYARHSIKVLSDSLWKIRFQFYAEEKMIKHLNYEGKYVPFIFIEETNNPENVTPEGIKKRYYDNPGEIVPHKKVEGKLFLLFKR